MTDVLSKRTQYSDDGLDESSFEPDHKSQKKLSKPGRKPLDTEPKNKRTAQNRAAQRAFRERKEQKMKDLEVKINNLENEKNSANTEAEFLRLQVQMLMNELAKHRGTNDLSDLNLPVKPISGRENSNLDVSPSSDGSSTFSPNESNKSSTDESSISANNHNNTKGPAFSFEFPWSRKNSVANTPSGTSKSPLVSASSNSNIPTLSSNASTTSTGTSPFELYNTDDQKDLPLFNQNKSVRNSNGNTQDFDFNEHFDEGISDFCSDLNSACGTKNEPIPKSKSTISTPLVENTKLSNDPLYFVNEQSNTFLNGYSTFDPSLAFDNNVDIFDDQYSNNELDPLAGLTTEESLYDPFGLFGHTTIQSKESPIVESNITNTPSFETPVSTSNSASTQIQSVSTAPTTIDNNNNNDDDNEVVPNKDQKFLKCTEIWDRITSHPKYSDIDIDGLCNELRAKAKCSDKGVVIDFVDVNHVIEEALR